MSRRIPARVLKWLAIAVAVIVLLLVAVQFWLGSGIGKGVVETRLSATLGRPVRLDGAFAVRIVPVPGASGTDLRVLTRDGRWLAIDAGRFLARLALKPLLRGEIEILALELQDAAFDLGRLSSEPSASEPAPGDYFRIPDIRRFELNEVSLFFDGMNSQPHIRIAQLAIEGLEANAAAPFEARVDLSSASEVMAGIQAEGHLTLRSGGVVEVNFGNLDLAAGNWTARGFHGGISADLTLALLGVVLETGQGGVPFRISTQARWNHDFGPAGKGHLIELMELVHGEDLVTGSGCLLNSEPPALHLSLSSESIDLDALYQRVSGWRSRSAANATSGTDADLPGTGASPDLPIQLGVELEADRTTYQGATAEGVRLRVGQDPACPPPGR